MNLKNQNVFEESTSVKVNSPGKYCDHANFSSGSFKLVYKYYNLKLACYIFKDSVKSKFLSGDNAAPSLNFAAPHFAAPHE